MKTHQLNVCSGAASHISQPYCRPHGYSRLMMLQPNKGSAFKHQRKKRRLVWRSFRPSVVLAYKTLLNFHKIRYSLQKKKKLLSRRNIRENWVGKRHSLLTDISERLPFIKIFTVRFERNLVEGIVTDRNTQTHNFKLRSFRHAISCHHHHHHLRIEKSA